MFHMGWELLLGIPLGLCLGIMIVVLLCIFCPGTCVDKKCTSLINRFYK